MRRFCLLLSIVFIACSAARAQDKIAITNVTVIDGTDSPPHAHATVIVQGKRIFAIIGENKKLPAGTKIIDGTGKFLIPGLWNNDLHGFSYAEAKASLADLVSYGITTVRDMGAPLNDIVRIRDATASGTLVGPHLFIAGPLMEGPVPMKMPLIADLFSENEAREEVTSLKNDHVDYIEVDTSLTPELYWAIADEARREGLPLVGHIPPKIPAEDVAKAGQRDVEHLGGRFLNVLISCSSDEAYFDQVNGKTYDDILLALREKRQANEPQFKADFDERLLNTFDENKAQKLYHLYAEKGVAQTPTLYVLNTLWQTNRDDQKLNDEDLQAGRRIFAKDLQVIGEMKKAGVTILAGTDGPYPQGGNALHSELELLVKAGLTPLQAIQAASRDAAKVMDVSKEVGTIEAGKMADMVLLDADPLEDISNTRKIAMVVLHGQIFSRKELSAMRSH